MAAVNPEKGAPGACWEALRALPINFPRKDEPRVPDHGQVFRAARRLLTGSPRLGRGGLLRGVSDFAEEIAFDCGLISPVPGG